MCDRDSDLEYVYMGSSFKSHAYINHYSHGDFAASAAANLAILSVEENRVSQAHASENCRKVMSADNLLQGKAFSLADIRFLWPSSEKKLVEVPRERCGWCHSCKAPVSSRRGCLLNSAALNATRGAMKIRAGLRPVKGGEGSLPSIATYILFMEESLRGLMVGHFLSANYRRYWLQTRSLLLENGTFGAKKKVRNFFSRVHSYDLRLFIHGEMAKERQPTHSLQPNKIYWSLYRIVRWNRRKLFERYHLPLLD